MGLTDIQWANYTFNPWRGCTKVAPECEHCYAEVDRSVKVHGVKWGPNGTRVVKAESGWREPLRWNAEAARCTDGEGKTSHDFIGDKCAKCGNDGTGRPRVFCASLGDVFEDWGGPMVDVEGKRLATCANACGLITTTVALTIRKCAKCDDDLRWLTMADVRARLFRLIDSTPFLDWLVLSKRPENARRMLGDKYRPNLWIGTSAGTQATADKAIPELLKCRDLAPVLFVSCEPMLERVDFTRLPIGDTQTINALTGGIWSGRQAMGRADESLDWVIFGGESGPNARPCNVEWIRHGVEQFRAAGVPAFVKQLGSRCVTQHANRPKGVPDAIYNPHGYKHGGIAYHAGWLKSCHKKGGDPAEWPEDLRVREFPKR